MLNLQNTNELKEAVDRALVRIGKEPVDQNWLRDLAEFLRWTRNASARERQSLDFQQKIWNDSPVSAVGQGNVNVDEAIRTDDFRAFVAELWEVELPSDSEARVAKIRELFDECMSRFQTALARQPRLKTLRVFAAAFPRDFTTIAHRRRLYQLEGALTGRKSKHVVESSRVIIDRLNGVLPATADSDTERAQRMMIPWVLYEEHVQKVDDTTTEQVTTRGDARLVPRPAASRRRGFSRSVDTRVRSGRFSSLCERDVSERIFGSISVRSRRHCKRPR
jgi:hypothetical protein